MLLALACGNSFLELGDASRLGRINNIRPQLVDVAKQAFYDFGERPIFSERMTYGTGTNFAFSHPRLRLMLNRQVMERVLRCSAAEGRA
jgi:hypothetical protein